MVEWSTFSSCRPIFMQVINVAKRLNRLTRNTQLIRRLKVNRVTKVFVTEEKLMYVTLPVNNQQDHV